VIILVTCLSSYCTSPDKQTKNEELTADEIYLVGTYVRLLEARESITVSPSKSDSLFESIDSAVDTARVTNTFRALREDPERWILIYQAIEEELARRRDGPQGATGSQGDQNRALEESGG
jgi:hypothetical protein